MKITRNFEMDEFVPSDNYEVTDKNMVFLKYMCVTLEYIRVLINEPVYITSGIRDLDAYFDLLNRGYHPSETSDHFFGNPVFWPDTGKYYTMSVGAADIVFANTNILSVYEQVKKQGWLDERIGQFLYEKDGSVEWIHVSNNPKDFYQHSMLELFPDRKKYLKSFNGGITWEE